MEVELAAAGLEELCCQEVSNPFQADSVDQVSFQAPAVVLYLYREVPFLDQASYPAPARGLYQYRVELYQAPARVDFLYLASSEYHRESQAELGSEG